MTISLPEFWKTLESVGICDKNTVKALSSAVSESKAGGGGDDPIKVAKYLIKRGTLTQYQAKLVLSSRGKELRRGQYLTLTDSCDSPFDCWVWVRHRKTSEYGMLSEIATDRLEAIKLPDQSKPLRSLQSYVCENEPVSSRVFSPLPKGRTLTQWFSKNITFKPSQIFSAGTSLIQAIASLSKSEVCPISLETDLIWVADTGEVILLFDPFKSLDESLLSVSSSSSRYLPPESNSVAKIRSVQSDIFSIGCILFRMATGRDAYPPKPAVPQESDTSDEVSPPSEIVDAIRQKATGSPLYRVLAHALAPNPNARFESFDHFLTAWSAANEASQLIGSKAQINEPRKSQGSSAEVSDGRSGGDLRSGERQDSNLVEATKGKGQLNQSTEKVKSEQVHKESAPAQVTMIKDENNQTPDSALLHPVMPTETLEKHQQITGKTSDESSDNNETSEQSVKTTKVGDRTRDTLAKTPNVGKGKVKRKVKVKKPNKQDSNPTLQVKADGFLPEKKKDIGVAKVTLKTTEKPSETPRSDDLGSQLFNYESSGGDKQSSVVDRSTSRATVRRRKKKSNAPLILGGMCVAVLMLLIGLIVGGSGGDSVDQKPEARRPLPTVIPPVTSKKTDMADSDQLTDNGAEIAGYELVEDDRILYAPPYGTDTDTVSLSLLPPGPTIILSCRLSRFIEHPIGSNLLRGVSTGIENLLEAAISRTKFPVENIKRITVATFPGDDGWPEVTLVISLEEAIEESELIDKLAVDQARTRENQTIYVGDQEDSDAFYWNTDEEGGLVTAFAIGSIPQISEVANLEGGEIPLPRTSQSLWSSSSVESDLVVLFTPNFLFADGREMLRVSAPELIKPLKRFLQPDINAGLITVRFNNDQTVFYETRFSPSGGMSEAALMQKVRESINALPDWANQFILDSVQDSSWKLLAIRMPQMMQYLAGKMRFGLSENAVVANTYLPDTAFPQLVFAGLLAMNTSTSVGNVAMNAPSELLSVEEMLDRKMTVSFDQESLEFALEAITTAFQDDLPSGNQMPRSVIVGGDLELMGITQNQQVRDFEKTQVPLRKVLTDLVLQANPDKTATGPQDPKQSLIWVVVQIGGENEIRITTRQAADREKYDVPAEFRPAE